MQTLFCLYDNRNLLLMEYNRNGDVLCLVQGTVLDPFLVSLHINDIFPGIEITPVNDFAIVDSRTQKGYIVTTEGYRSFRQMGQKMDMPVQPDKCNMRQLKKRLFL